MRRIIECAILAAAGVVLLVLWLVTPVEPQKGGIFAFVGVDANILFTLILIAYSIWSITRLLFEISEWRKRRRR